MSNELKAKVGKYESFIEVLRTAQLVLGEYVKAVKENGADVIMNDICLDGYLLTQCNCNADCLDDAYCLLRKEGFLEIFGNEVQ